MSKVTWIDVGLFWRHFFAHEGNCHESALHALEQHHKEREDAERWLARLRAEREENGNVS